MMKMLSSSKSEASLQSRNKTNNCRYVNTGNSKFGALTIEMLAEGDLSSLKYSLFVDGEEAWNTVLTTPSPATVEKTAPSFWDRVRGVV